MTLDQFFTDFYHPLRLRNRSHNTLRLYRRSIELFGQSLGRPATLDDLTDDQVCRHLAKLSDPGRKRKLSVYTVDKERAQLLAIWNYAARKGHVKLFPDVPRDTPPKLTPVAWMPDELRRLVASCQAEMGVVAGIPACDWWVAIHLVFWDTGERIGAMLQVTWDGLTDGWLKFPAAIRKGKRADKVFKLGDDTLRALDRIREPKRELIFPWDRRASVLYDHYNRILAGAGLPTDSKSKFHRLRRSAASHYKASGGDATELLDHADARVTKKYLDPRIVQQENACDVLFRIVPGEPIDPPARPQAAAVRHVSPAVQPAALVARAPIPVDRPGLPEDVTVVEYARYLQGTDRVSYSWGRCLLNAATQLQSWNGRPVEMRRLNEETVSGFLGYLARDGAKASKQRDSRSMLRSLWRHGQIDGIAFGARVDRPARLPAPTRSYVNQKSAYGLYRILPG